MASQITNFEVFQFFQLFITIFLGILFVQWLLRIRKLPPGPWGLPIFGYMPFLKKEFLEEQFKKLSTKYGDVFGFHLGQQYIVVLSSFDAIKEAFIKQGDNFSGRPQNYSYLNVFQQFKSEIVTDGEVWKEQRRFIISSLRDFGLGKLSIEGKIHEEAEVILDILRQEKKTIEEFSLLLSYMTTNVICSMCFGKRYEYDDKQLEELINVMDVIQKLVNEGGITVPFPFLRFLPSSWIGMDKIQYYLKKGSDFVDLIIDEHIQNFDPNNPRDIVDMYLQKRHDLGIDNNDDDSNSLYSRLHMQVNLILLFFAGTDTTSSVLFWAFFLMTKYSDVQKKVQEELDRVIGRSRLPSWKDRNDLPYTEATLLEIQRFASLAPLSMPHSNIEEAVVKGFTIPERSMIIINSKQVHYDPNLWKDPEVFNPSRFLNSRGTVENSEFLIPFSIGKRICLGESLARMELLIFFSAILQNFSFVPNDKDSLESNVLPGVLRKVPPFNATIQPR